MKARPCRCRYCGNRHIITDMRFPDCYRAYRRNYYHERLKHQPPREKLPDDRKRCAGCKKALPLDAFFRCRSKSKGRESRCKVCAKAVKQVNRKPLTKRQKAARAAYLRRYRAGHPEKFPPRDMRRYRLEKQLERIGL